LAVDAARTERRPGMIELFVGLLVGLLLGYLLHRFVLTG
jgi:F0F1-type ATP synthase assembly protein I